MYRRLLTIGTVMVCLAGVAAYADDASKQAKVEEFFKLAKMDETLRQAMDMMKNQVRSGVMQQLMGVKLSAEQEKASAEFMDKATHLITDALAWEKLKPDYVKLFSDAYTESELDDILTFYRSPTGQAMVAKNPALMMKASGMVQEKMAAVVPELQKLVRDYMESGRAPVRK